jgi:TRAP-type C4-dicarboxylate transport system permease small subunit
VNSKPRNKYDRILDRLLDVTMIITGILIIFLLITVCIDVSLRNITGRPTEWIVEISGHVLVYLPFLAGAWALKNEKHVKMDLIFNYMSPKSQALLNSIMYAVGAMVCVACAWYGSQVTTELLRTGFPTQGVLKMPEWPIMIIIPLGFVLLVLEFIRRTQSYWGAYKSLGKKPVPQASQPAEAQGGH